MSRQPPEPDKALDGQDPLPCLCAALRRAGRVLTRRYDLRLKPSGLKITQYSMLANIARNPGVSVTELAGLLAMDQTTVTRNLGVLERAGYIRSRADKRDQRVRQVALSPRGKAKLDQARPLWDQAQAEMAELLGREGFAALLREMAALGD